MKYQSSHIVHSVKFLGKWLILTACIGFFAGSASALFLYLLALVTDFRIAHPEMIYGLPIVGGLIGAMYFWAGDPVNNGNNQILKTIQGKAEQVPLLMAPWVLITTLLTHIVGASAGREGTAVQMSGAMADFFGRKCRLNENDQKTLLIASIAAGFASVFGTPLAGTIFALEVVIIGKVRYDSLIPALFAAIFAHFVCVSWGAGHTHYPHIEAIPLSLNAMGLTAFVGLVCGGIARVFAQLSHWISHTFKTCIAYPPLRPIVGGGVLLLIFSFTDAADCMGLGIPSIVAAFEKPAPYHLFAAKLVLTTFTLSVGFKGGEVTPLFFIGATLGSALAVFLPHPVAFWASLGFVAVFAGATHTPIACTLMAMELFGADNALYFGLACCCAYLSSGNQGIYTAQIVGVEKMGNENVKFNKKMISENK